MATPSRVGMNRARHKAGLYSKQKEEAKKKEQEWKERNPESDEERKKKEDYILNVLGLKKDKSE